MTLFFTVFYLQQRKTNTESQLIVILIPAVSLAEIKMAD